MFYVRIYVYLKRTVADPQGKTVKQALHSLDFSEVEDIRIGKYIEIKIKTKDKAEAEKKIKDMCQKLLVNPIVEEYTFAIEKI